MGNKKAREGRWEGEREEGSSPPFLSSHRPPRAYYFFLIITGISSGIPAEEKGRDENTTEDKLMTLTSRKD